MTCFYSLCDSAYRLLSAMYLLGSSSCGLRRGSWKHGICAITLRLCFSCSLREEGGACPMCFAGFVIARDIFVTPIYDVFWYRTLNMTVYHSRVYFSGIFSVCELLLYVDNCLLILVCLHLQYTWYNLSLKHDDLFLAFVRISSCIQQGNSIQTVFIVCMYLTSCPCCSMTPSPTLISTANSHIPLFPHLHCFDC